jgi:hypothetical protein
MFVGSRMMLAEPEPVPGAGASLRPFARASSRSAAAFACDSPYFSSESAELWLEMYASTIDVAMKMVAAVAVSLRRNVDAPEPPNTVAALPPPNAPPMPPPLPLCRSTVSIKNRHVITCKTVSRVDMRT